MTTPSDRRPPIYNLATNGPLLLTISAIIFAVMAVFVRISGQQGIPGSEATFVRFLFGILTVIALQSSGIARVRVSRFGLWSLRGILGGSAILFYFMSLSAARGPDAISLTNSVFLGNSYFVYAPIFGALLIRERLCRGTVLMVIVALVGLYFVAELDLSRIRPGDVYGFLSGLIGALALITVRELRKTESATSIFLSLCLFGALASLIGMMAEGFIIPDAQGWRILAIIGIMSTVGQLLLTYAMRYMRAGEAGIIQMSTVIYSSAAGIAFFGDPLTLRILLGAVLVLGSATYISLVQNRLFDCDSNE